MLVRVVLESFGAAAVALGPAFVRAGTLLRLVLLPTLERIGAVSYVLHGLVSSQKPRSSL